MKAGLLPAFFCKLKDNLTEPLLKSIIITILLTVSVLYCNALSSPIDTCIGEPFHKVIQSINGNRIAINDMSEDAEGNIYLAGRIEISANNYDAFFIKTDNSGNLLWQRTFDISANDECWKIATAKNGDVFISGFFLYDLFLIRADKDGNILFSKGTSQIPLYLNTTANDFSLVGVLNNNYYANLPKIYLIPTKLKALTTYIYSGIITADKTAVSYYD